MARRKIEDEAFIDEEFNDRIDWIVDEDVILHDETYKEFALTDADLTALSGKNIYVYKGDNSAITKVSLLSEDTGGSTAVNNANANVKATKIIRNGQVVIIRDNKEYSIFGYEL